GGIAIGQNATASGPGDIAIGNGATVGADNSVAIGKGAFVSENAPNSVAIGAGSVANEPNVVSVGAPGSERRIVNVADGQNAYDAVNVRQLAAVRQRTVVNAANIAQNRRNIDINRQNITTNAANIRRNTAAIENLDERFNAFKEKATKGIAMANALTTPVLSPGDRGALSMGLGYF